MEVHLDFGWIKTIALTSIPSESCHQSCRRRKSCRITARTSPRSTTPTSGRRSSPRRAASTFPSRSTKDVSTCSCFVVFHTSANLGGICHGCSTRMGPVLGAKLSMSTLVMIYNARGEMSLVWALGKNTSPGHEVGVNQNFLYLVMTNSLNYS